MKRAIAIAFLSWVTHLAFGLLGSAPLSLWVESFYQQNPRGGAPLWDPGGDALVDLVFRALPHLSALSTWLLVFGLFHLVGRVVLSGWQFSAFSHAEEGLGAALVRSIPKLPSLFLVYALFTAAKCITLVTGIAAGDLLEGAFEARSGEYHGAVAKALVVLLCLATTFALTVPAECSASRVIARRENAWVATSSALSQLRKTPLPPLRAWLGRSFACAAVFLLAAWTSSHLRHPFSLFLVHQAAMVARICASLSFRRFLLRESGTPVRTDEPPAPNLDRVASSGA